VIAEGTYTPDSGLIVTCSRWPAVGRVACIVVRLVALERTRTV